MRSIFFLLVLVSCCHILYAQGSYREHEELGEVHWLRNYDEATLEASRTGKPILILFQEVPGCATCRNYGNNILSDPLMVEMIETAFVPLTIFNNKSGPDRSVLNRFREPTWNNPVVRIVDQHGEDVVRRLSGDYSALGLHSTISDALQAYDQTIPSYFTLLGQQYELDVNSQFEEATYQMYCFWSGEAHLGQHEAVRATEVGFAQGAEVVTVRFDPAVASREDLRAFAQIKNITEIKGGDKMRPSIRDDKYHLKNSEYNRLDLIPIQRTRINSALAQKQDPTVYLSPKQLEALERS